MAADAYDLELEGVTKRFDGVAAVESLSLRVSSGEFLSILGPSGCGKTTTLRLVAGFEAPDEGAIRLKGRDIARVPPYERDVNTVFQHYALFPHLDVARNVGYGPSIRRGPPGEIAARVEEALALVHMRGFESRFPHELSGGQQQRVALARALINKPSVLLLDEPLGALDLQVRRHMQFELKRIQRDLGITFIYVTHDQEEALTLSNRIVVMRSGRIDQIGTPEEVYYEPTTPFVLQFVGTSNVFEGRLRAVERELAELTTAAGLAVRSRLGRTLRDGARGRVGVRPERITLAGQPGPQNSLPGEVVDTTFQGAQSTIRVRLDAETAVDVTCPPATARPARGDRVWVHWSYGDSLLFVDDEARA
ncbi:MAG: ABC transporter ATP-binding protein [Burkholderiales bacterium]